VQFTDSLQIPEDQGPRSRLKWREGAVYSITSEGAVYSITSNTSGPRPQLKLREGALYSITSNTRGPRTEAQTEVDREKVQFTASLQIPEDQGPRTKRLKRREGAINSITSNTRGPRTKAQTEVGRRCSLQTHFKYQKSKDQGPD
jgi:hypothetical protein